MFSAAVTVRGTGVGLAAVTGAVWSLLGLSQINDACGIYSVSCADKHAPGFETASALANVGVTAATMAVTGPEAAAAEEGEVAGVAATDAEEAEEQACNAFDHCFVIGTLIQMADGTTKPIEDVAISDVVKSRDMIAGEDEDEPVLNVFAHPADQVVRFTLSDGEEVACTPQHRIFVAGKGIEEAGALEVGDELFDDQTLSSGTYTDSPTYGMVAVTSVTWDSLHSDLITQSMVYNFEVADTHTYFIGKELGGVWIHNGCAEPDINNLDTHAINSMVKRKWTSADIMDAYRDGEQFPADDYTSRLPDGTPSPAMRFVNPNTGAAVTINNATGRVIQVGEPDFKY